MESGKSCAITDEYYSCLLLKYPNSISFSKFWEHYVSGKAADSNQKVQGSITTAVLEQDTLTPQRTG